MTNVEKKLCKDDKSDKKKTKYTKEHFSCQTVLKEGVLCSQAGQADIQTQLVKISYT